MTTRNFATPFAAALLGGAMLAAAPALAQSQQGWSGDRGGSRDWVQSRDPMDPYDRYLQRLERQGPSRGWDDDNRRSSGGRDMSDWRSGGSQGDRGSDRGDMARSFGREQFERGYRAGREDERRRRGGQFSGSSDSGDRSSSSSGGRGSETDYYWVVPDILPDTQRYRGMQDFALIPDYSRPMDRLLIAAQSLREAIQATATRLSPSDGRDRALDRLHEALIETQQAMVALPPSQRLR